MSPSEPTGRFTRATGAALAGLLLVPATAIAAVAIVGVTSSVPEETGRQLETPIALESEESSDHSSDADDNDGSSTSITIQGDENDDDGSVTSTTLDDDDDDDGSLTSTTLDDDDDDDDDSVTTTIP